MNYSTYYCKSFIQLISNPILLESISLKVSLLYVRLPHKDCKLEPPAFSPLNQDVEFEDKEVEQVVCNIFPIHNDAWDFALITESCNIVRFRAKSTKV